MTEKRFVYYEHKGADYILDTPNESLDFIEMLGDCLEAEEIVDRLNELNDENQLLHKINEDTIDFMYDNFDLNIIFTDRELNDICNEMGWELSEKGIKINQLKKENERLKKENYELHKRLGDFEPFEEHIKERTSKTSVNDIIGLVKTDEQQILLN